MMKYIILMTLLLQTRTTLAKHQTSGCFKGSSYLYTGKDFDQKDRFCYLKINSHLDEGRQSFLINDLIINCLDQDYLEHYQNLTHDLINQQIYLANEQWVGSYQQDMIQHIQVPNGEEIKSFYLLYEVDPNGNFKSRAILFQNENLLAPEKSYRIEAKLNQTCQF